MTTTILPTISTTVDAPNHIPFLRAETSVAIASTDYEGQYTTRYVCDEVRDRIADSLLDDDNEQNTINEILEEVEADADHFYAVTGAEGSDSFNGIETGHTTNTDCIANIVDQNIGRTLAEFIQGVPFEGGTITVDLDHLEIAAAEIGLVDEDWDLEFVNKNAARYVLRDGSNFILEA